MQSLLPYYGAAGFIPVISRIRFVMKRIVGFTGMGMFFLVEDLYLYVNALITGMC